MLFTNSSGVFAGEFSDTTTGRIEESKDSYGLPSDRALTSRGKKIMEKFKSGRLSSAKDVNSRFSGYLEFHDANLDGVVDHEVGDSNNGLEGRMTSLLPPGEDLKKRTLESQKKANTQFCGKEEGTRNEKSGKSACFSPSGIIVDTGAAHGGKDDPHRKLRLSDEAAKASEEAGKDYGTAAIKNIEDAMREEYDIPKDMKVAAIDHLKSEVAWLEEQKTNTLERSWKALRAARLAGMDTSRDTAADSPGAEFMHEVDLEVSKGADESAIAEKIAVNSSIQQQQFVKNGNNWELLDEQKHKAMLDTARSSSDPEALSKISKSFSELKRDEENLDADKISDLHQQAKAKALESAKEDEDFQKNLAQIQKCLGKDVWCHNENTASDANRAAAEAGGSGGTSEGVKPFTEVTGDPGEVFQDARELVYLKLAEAQNAPIEEIESIVTNYDFNRETDPEYFKQLDELKKNTQDMQQANEARGNKDYDTAKQSVQKFSGIRMGVNDSFREEGTEAPVETSLGSAMGSSPAATATLGDMPRAPASSGLPTIK